jgi:putative transposase
VDCLIQLLHGSSKSTRFPPARDIGNRQRNFVELRRTLSNAGPYHFHSNRSPPQSVQLRFRPLAELQSPTIRHRNLPHWEIQGATYLITFRLDDALPNGVLREIEITCSAWLKYHGIKNRQELRLLPEGQQREFRRLFTAKEEHWLDAGHGSSALRNAGCRIPLIATLREFDGVRYVLDAFVIMPNHVHALVLPLGNFSLSQINSTWKKFSSRRINQMLKRTGRLWQTESHDHLVRNAHQLARIRKYIQDNPIKGRLRDGEYALGTGSGIAA